MKIQKTITKKGYGKLYFYNKRNAVIGANVEDLDSKDYFFWEVSNNKTWETLGRGRTKTRQQAESSIKNTIKECGYSEGDLI